MNWMRRTLGGGRHMSGNVSELTQSCWTEVHLGLPSDGAYLANAASRTSCRRVDKGGDFSTALDGIRLAWRNRPTENYKRDFLGFRIIRELNIAGDG